MVLAKNPVGRYDVTIKLEDDNDIYHGCVIAAKGTKNCGIG